MKWETAYRLFDAYVRVNTDSTNHYVLQMLELDWDLYLVARTKVCRARYYSQINHSRLESLMPELIEMQVDSAFMSRYYSILIDIYYRHPFISSYASHYLDILESSIELGGYGADTLLWYDGLVDLAYNKTNEAIGHLNSAYSIASDPSLKGRCAELLAEIYSNLGSKELEKIWLVKSAIEYIHGYEGELKPLYRLALILSDEGDYSRAATYIRTVMERASSTGFPDLVVGTATGSLAVSATLDDIERTRRNILFSALAFLIIVLVVILVMLVRDRRNSRIILKTKESLVKSNDQLVDVNKIVDSYLIRYMNLSISYLVKIDQNRRHLKRILKEEGVDSLKAELRRPSGTTEEYKEFYRTFDNIFLGIYPDFVKKVNACYREEDRFKENGKLTTPLRILALIRLGFTESGEIARFLNCSPETIYSHRSKLKSKAMCDRFEDKIKNIGK